MMEIMLLSFYLLVMVLIIIATGAIYFIEQILAILLAVSIYTFLKGVLNVYRNQD